MVKNHIKKRLREWRKENLQMMKDYLIGMSYVGEDEELMRRYRWLAEDSLRLKDIIKTL